MSEDAPVVSEDAPVVSTTCDASEDRDQLEQIAAEVLPRFRTP